MKTKEQVQNLIDKQLFILSTQRASADKKEKKTQNEIDFLKFVLRYLESEPRPEFINAEIKRLNERKQKILSVCAEFKSKTSIAKYKAAQDFAQINKQLKTLEFLC